MLTPNTDGSELNSQFQCPACISLRSPILGGNGRLVLPDFQALYNIVF